MKQIMKMTNEDALNKLKGCAQYAKTAKFKYMTVSVDALEVAIDALERRIPKDVIMGDVCPNCGSRGYTETGDTFLDYRLIYCDNCGQHLKWTDEEE